MLTLYKSIIVLVLFFATFTTFSQTTNTNGTCNSWKTNTCWDNSAPISAGIVTVKSGNNMILDAASTTIAITGTYNFYGRVTDNGNGYKFDVQANNGTLNIGSNTTNATSYFAGTGSFIRSKGTLHIFPGDTLIVGAPGTAANVTVLEWENNSNITIDAGGVLIINGRLTNDNGSNKVTINGVLIVNGDVNVSNGSSFDGNGSISASGSIGGGGKVFGSSGYSCTGPGCSTGCIINTISSNQSSVCSGTAPATISGSTGTGYVYTWQSSTTSSSSGFINITGANSASYTPTALTTTTWFRRNVTLSTCSSPNSTSGAIQISVNALPSVNITGSTTICVGSSTTLSPIIGGTWSSNLPSVATVTNSGIVTGVSGGSATFTFTSSTSPSCSATTSAVITTSVPVANFSYSGPYCKNGVNPSPSFSGGGMAGTFSSTAGLNFINNKTGQINLSTSTAGTYIVTNSIAASGGCSAVTATASVTINSSPTATISSSGLTNFCSGNNVSLTASSGDSYLWSTGETTSTIVVTASGSYTVTVTKNGCSSTSSPTIVTVDNNCSYTWTGNSGQVWSNSGNWSGNVVPGAANDVIIPLVTNMPVISGSASCRNITIASGMTLTNNSGANFSITGDITNNGTFIDNGTVILSGNSNQKVSGVGSFNNMILFNNSGVKLNNAITINGVLTLSKGMLNPNGNLLTVNLNTGAISGEGTGSISEPIRVFKDVGTKWHHIGNPLGGTGILLSQLADNTSIGSNSLYYYDETVKSTTMEQGWTVLAPSSLATTNMEAMKGYNLYVGPTKTTFDFTGTYNHTFSTSVTLTNSSSGNSLADGWNLLSNPYPSTIDWDAPSGLTKSGIDGAVYVYDKSTDKYMSYNNTSGTNTGSQYIGSMQGFWVKCNSSAGTISITKDARVVSPVMKVFKAQSAFANLKLTLSSNGYSDETIIKFSEEGTSDFDPSLDAYKFNNFGKNPNICSKLNGVEYSINALSDTTKDEILPLKITTAFAGLYKINVNLNEFINSDMDVILIDKHSNISQDLKLESDYLFQTSSTDSNRFFIRIKQKDKIATGMMHENNTNVFMGSDGSVVTIKLNSSLSNANMSILNTLGNEVYKNEVNMTGGLITELIRVSTSGIYIVRLNVGDQIYTGRVYLK